MTDEAKEWREAFNEARKISMREMQQSHVEWTSLRPEVQAFARLVETQLRANDHKGGWSGCSPEWLVAKLSEELGEVARYVVRRADRGHAAEVAKECADIAAVAMMLADVCGGLKR